MRWEGQLCRAVLAAHAAHSPERQRCRTPPLLPTTGSDRLGAPPPLPPPQLRLTSGPTQHLRGLLLGPLRLADALERGRSMMRDGRECRAGRSVGCWLRQASPPPPPPLPASPPPTRTHPEGAGGACGRQLDCLGPGVATLLPLPPPHLPAALHRAGARAGAGACGSSCRAWRPACRACSGAALAWHAHRRPLLSLTLQYVVLWWLGGWPALVWGGAVRQVWRPTHTCACALL